MTQIQSGEWDEKIAAELGGVFANEDGEEPADDEMRTSVPPPSLNTPFETSEAHAGPSDDLDITMEDIEVQSNPEDDEGAEDAAIESDNHDEGDDPSANSPPYASSPILQDDSTRMEVEDDEENLEAPEV